MGSKHGRLHPCQSCGACCASFRVAFYWRESEPSDTDNPVPRELSVDLSPTHRIMKGTEHKHHPKCIALKGRVGSHVECSIYSQRSSTCRRFEASYENGKHNPRCDEARAKHGLSPLGREDFSELNHDEELR